MGDRRFSGQLSQPSEGLSFVTVTRDQEMAPTANHASPQPGQVMPLNVSSRNNPVSLVVERTTGKFNNPQL